MLKFTAVKKKKKVANPKGDYEFSEVEVQRLLSNSKNTSPHILTDQIGGKKTTNCLNLFGNTDTVRYNLPIPLADQTLVKKQHLS